MAWVRKFNLLLLLLLAALGTSLTTSKRSKVLPSGPLNIGYANWNQCDDRIWHAVKSGVNVIMWFAIDLGTDEDGGPIVYKGPDMDCVAQMAVKIRKSGLNVVHLISIGGWNAPHPTTDNPAQLVWEKFRCWNENKVARFGWDGFDGIDWDIEGNDDPESPHNKFSVACLDLMGQLSQLAKADGYLVAMAPAESYLDVTTSKFNRKLNYNHPEWEKEQPKFLYHGRNVYAYLLARYGSYNRQNTFDFISIQLYEGYSHANYAITRGDEEAVEYLVKYIKSLYAGWIVNFAEDADLAFNEPAYHVAIKPENLVLGVANGWTSPGKNKFLFIEPKTLEKVYLKLFSEESQPRGFMFWTIGEEGNEVPNCVSCEEKFMMSRAISQVYDRAAEWATSEWQRQAVTLEADDRQSNGQKEQEAKSQESQEATHAAKASKARKFWGTPEQQHSFRLKKPDVKEKKKKSTVLPEWVAKAINVSKEYIRGRNFRKKNEL